MVGDIFRYYHYAYMAVYCLAAIVVIATVLAFRKRDYAKFSLIFSTVAGVGLAANLLFTGVLADNRIPALERWSGQSWVIAGCCLGLWVVQLVLALGGRRKGK